MAWRRKGALYSALALPDAPDAGLGSPEEILGDLRRVWGHVIRGELTPAQGAVLKGLADSALRTFELNTSRRLAELEAVLSKRAKPVGAFVIEEGEA
jgi:hypothetical protein